MPPATKPLSLEQPSAEPKPESGTVRLLVWNLVTTGEGNVRTMNGMGSWEADAPGNYGPWWVTRRRYFPASLSQQFDDFVAALNQHNAALTPATLEELSSAAKLLINAVGASGRGPKLSVRDRVALAVAPKLRSSTAPKSPTDNLITAVRNVIQGFGGHIVPDAYEV